MSVRDARNQEINVGDVVSLEIPSTRVVGDVNTVNNGGIVTGINRAKGGMQATMGEVIVIVAFRINVDPTNPIIPNMLKLYNGENLPEVKKIELMQ